MRPAMLRAARSLQLSIARLAIAAAVMLAAPAAAAAPCAGFTDVDDAVVGPGFCSNVTWLRNRSITLGCGSTTLYCPNDPVSRLAMAAFMNRLGVALTPVQLAVEAEPGALDVDASPVVCQTADFTADDFSRVAYLDAYFGASAAAEVGVAADLVVSLDAGSNWWKVNLAGNRGHVPAGRWGTLTDLGFAVIAAETTARFGLGVSRAGPAGTTDLLASRCNVRARIVGLNESEPAVVKLAALADGSEVGPVAGQFRVMRYGAVSAALPIQFSLSGTATPCTDYACIAAIVIAAGQDSVDVPVSVLQDTQAEGTETVVLTLTPGAGYVVATPSATVSIANGPAPSNQAPLVNAGPDQAVTLPASAALAGTATDDGNPNPPGALTFAWSKVSGPGIVTFGNAQAANTTASFSLDGVYVLRLTANDSALSAQDDVQVAVSPVGGGGLPPEPSTVATHVQGGVPSDLGDDTAFLYTGSNPIQTGVTPGTIDRLRAAVLRGKVRDRSGTPIGGVAISILNHPTLGQTLTRLDGRFDLAVNGGGVLTLNYAKAGYLPVQRQLKVPVLEYSEIDDVVLTALDSKVTTIAANAGAIQVHRANPASDADGSRTATLLFPASTTATMTLSNGTTQPLTSLDVRATEYTVGADGPRAMPAALPPASGYTYAVELSVDQALVAGATRVTFSQPVVNYVENFPGFPVGGAVPTGYYDRAKAAWVPSLNGRVIKIIGITGGLADVDSVGTGSLVALSLSNAERQQLATLYTVGQELWRVPIPHFTPWDHNWPYGPPGDATVPNVPDPFEAGPLDEPTCSEGSVVECENQTLGEQLDVAGTSFALTYRSSRVPARTDARSLDIVLSGASLPPSLLRIELDVGVAGRFFRQSFPPLANQKTSFTWDGLDAYGRTLVGAQRATVAVHYVYRAVYQSPAGLLSSFGAFGSGAVAGNRQAAEIVMSQRFATTLGAVDARTVGLGGWMLSPHHVYDPAKRMLHLGDGTQRSVRSLPAILEVARNPNLVLDVAVAPDGTRYVSYNGNPRGFIARYAPGSSQWVELQLGANGPDGPYGMAVGPDGSLYFTERFGHRIRRITPSGTLELVAGTGVQGFAGDGGLATAARLSEPWGIAIANDGSIYFSDSNNRRIRRIRTDGIINTVAGGVASVCTSGPCGDGGPATLAYLDFPSGIAFGPDGSLFVTEGQRVRRIGIDGIITRVAGTGVSGFSGDGGPAVLAKLSGPRDVGVSRNGTLYFAEGSSGTVRQVTIDGTIETVAGTGIVNEGGPSAAGRPARSVALGRLSGLAIGPDDSVYFSDGGSFLNIPGNGLLKITSAFAGASLTDIAVPSASARALFVFDPRGRHLRTLEALTGATLMEFTYDAQGRLASVIEKTGGTDNVTSIQRNASGQPTAIVAPFGQVTQLAVDGNGFLSGITTPSGAVVQLASNTGGALTSLTDPRGSNKTYQYDALGRLVQAVDAAGGVQTLVRAELANGFSVTRTNARGDATVMRVEQTGTDAMRTSIAPDGSTSVLVKKADGSTHLTAPDGTVTETTHGPDPRFGMAAAFPTLRRVTTPGGLVNATTGERTATLANPADPLSLVTLTDRLITNGRIMTSVYTAATRTNVLTSPAGRARTTVHDTLGRTISSQAGGLAATATTYDSRGRVATVTRGSGAGSRSFTASYAGTGFLQSVTDNSGRTVQYTHDADGRVLTKTLASIGTLAIAYNPLGDWSAVTPPGRPAHAFAYGPRGELTSVTPPPVPGSAATTFGYDAARNLLAIGRPGETVSLGYDTAGRVASIGSSAPSVPAYAVGFGYDGVGRLATLTGPGAQTLTNTLDGDLLTSIAWTGPFASSVAWTYDTEFRITGETIPGAGTLALGYDADNLPIAVGGLSITRDAQTGLATGATLGVLAETFGYDAFGEAQARTLTASGSPVYAVTYTRDASGRIAQKQETVLGTTETHVYSYDALGQLTQVTRNGVVVETYIYDANGNRTSATVGGSTVAPLHDAQDRLLAAGTTTYVHSAAGKLQSKTSPGGTTAYRYDALGNLLDVTLPGGTIVAYRHDGWDRRVQRLVNGTVTAQYVRSGDRILAELDGAGALVSRFAYVTGLVPATMVRGGVTYRFVADGNGSVRLVVNAATGAVAQRLDYDTFGRVVQDTNPGFQPFGFGGGHYDPATGLVRFGARDYDAQAGRWTARDPIGFAGGDGNLYRYAGNDPVNRADPSGLITGDDVMNFAAGAGEAAQAGQVFMNPVMLPAVVIDGALRFLFSQLGLPPSGPSLYEAYTEMGAAYPDMPYFQSMIDRGSDAYRYGELGVEAMQVCVGGGGLLRRAGESLFDWLRMRQFRRMADDLAREVAEGAERRARRAAAEAAARSRVEVIRGAQGSGGGFDPVNRIPRANPFNW